MTDMPRTERSRTAVEERFVVEVQSYLEELMDLREMNRSQLAKALGVSRGRVTQIFSDECTNLTIRLLARAAHALGEEPIVTSRSVQTLRETKLAARRASAIEACDNVVPLKTSWIVSSPDNAAVPKTSADDDQRLQAFVERAREVGAR